MRTGELRQLTKAPSRRLHADLVARRQRDRLRVDARERRVGVGGERAPTAPSARCRPSTGARRCAVVGPGRPDRLSRHRGGRRAASRSSGKPITGSENVFAFRASWASPTDFLYVSDGKIRRRTRRRRQPLQTVDFTATMQVTQRRQYTHRVRDFTSTTPRKVLGIVRPVISPDGTQIAFAAVGDIYVMPVGGKPRQPHQGRGARHRSGVVARRRRSSSTRRTRTARTCSSGSAT